MSNEMENKWLHFNVSVPIKEHQDPFRKIELLLNSKIEVNNLFGGNNYMIQYIDNLIDIEKLKMDEQKFKALNKDNKDENLFDYSDNNLKERIAFLSELGILGYLVDLMNNNKLYFSTNKLAEIISTFTGINSSTCQSYLNPVYSPQSNQKNNPLTDRNKKKVKNSLQSIGLNLIKPTSI
jgi:hypothetical protein